LVGAGAKPPSSSAAVDEVGGSKRLTKACLQSAGCEEDRDEIEESGKTSIGLFVAGCDASECLETAEEVLDQMAPFVHFGIMRDAPGPVGLGRDDRCGPAVIQIGTQPVVVEGLVADERLKIETRVNGSTPMLS
jgi:hypothetical protein